MVKDTEICDVVDEYGMPTGRVVERGTKLPAGQFYPVVHVWIRDQAGKFLIQRRALYGVSDPGVWATTVGYVLAGEDSLTGAIREVQEEIGILLSPGQLRRWKRHAMENRVEDIWFAVVSSNSAGVPALGPEVSECRWVSDEELTAMVNQGDFFRYSYLEKLLAEQWR